VSKNKKGKHLKRAAGNAPSLVLVNIFEFQFLFYPQTKCTGRGFLLQRGNGVKKLRLKAVSDFMRNESLMRKLLAGTVKWRCTDRKTGSPQGFFTCSTATDL